MIIVVIMPYLCIIIFIQRITGSTQHRMEN